MTGVDWAAFLCLSDAKRQTRVLLYPTHRCDKSNCEVYPSNDGDVVVPRQRVRGSIIHRAVVPHFYTACCEASSESGCGDGIVVRLGAVSGGRWTEHDRVDPGVPGYILLQPRNRSWHCRCCATQHNAHSTGYISHKAGSPWCTFSGPHLSLIFAWLLRSMFGLHNERLTDEVSRG